MQHSLSVVAVLALVCPMSLAQETNPQQRQDNRQERRENRQENRQEAVPNRNQPARPEARQDRQAGREEIRQQRAEFRLNNRSQYYNDQSWGQLDPWFQRNNVTTTGRIARAANAAVGATERALNTANNIANNNIANQASKPATARFGFANPNGAGENAWFYDYYNYAPTSYNAPATGTAIYGSATRYFDLDGDGLYESLNVFRDSDNNASYDTYDRYDFSEIQPERKDQSAEALLDSPEDANRHTVTGKVYASKIAKVNGNENLIVRLSEAEARGDSPEARIVDLGPASHWKEHPLQVDDGLTVTGPIERIGEKRILIAQTVKVGDSKATTIARSAPKLEGQVVDVTATEVKGKEHTLAIIETESQRQVVDLGPADNLKVKVEPRTKIVVQGVPVQVRNRSIVQAEQVTIDGQEIEIKRW